MTRVASLYLPALSIERLRRSERPRAQPEARATPSLPVDDDPGACSVPRGGHWRPGARWARGEDPARAAIAAEAGRLALHQQPTMRELGRRSEAAEHPFRGRQHTPLAAAPTPSRREEPAAAPLILASQVGNRQLIAASCPAARALGLAPGMPVTQARACSRSRHPSGRFRSRSAVPRTVRPSREPALDTDCGSERPGRAMARADGRHAPSRRREALLRTRDQLLPSPPSHRAHRSGSDAGCGARVGTVR